MVMAEETRLRRGDRVSIDKDVHELYKQLTERSAQNPETSPFYLMKDVFMWSVALGVSLGKRRSLRKREQIFRWDQLSQDIDVPILKALAIAETGSVEVISHEDQVLRIAEEYANAGIRELKREVVNRPAKPLWNLVDLARQSITEGKASQ